MPTLVHKSGGSAEFSPEQVAAAVASGEWSVPDGGALPYVSASGATSTLTPAEAEISTGAAGRLPVNAAGNEVAPALERSLATAYSGLGDQLLGAAEGAASVLTLSGSDWALDALGADTALREKHTVGRTIGEVGALLGTALSPFGTGKLAKALVKTPAGAISKFGTGGSTALARVAHTAGEGAAYGLAQASTNLALSEPGVAAENWLAELGQGALLGMALGGSFGVIGEVGRSIGRARRVGSALDLDSGPGKDAVRSLADSHRTVDDALDWVATEEAHHANKLAMEGYTTEVARRKAVAAADAAEQTAYTQRRAAKHEAISQEYVARHPLRNSLDEMRQYRDELESMVAGRGEMTLNTAEPLIKRMNAIALKVGDPRLPPVIWDDLVENVLEAGSVAQGKQLTALVRRADTLTKKFERVVKSEADDFAEKQLASEAALGLDGPPLPRPPEPALVKPRPAKPKKLKLPEAFNLMPGEKLTGKSIANLLRSAEKNPDEFLKRIKEVDEYYGKAIEATRNNPVAAARVDEAVAGYKAALDSIVPAETQKLLSDPQVLATALALSEVAIPEGTPGKSLLQIAAAVKLGGGVVGRGGRGRSRLAQAINSIGRRTTAGLLSGLARSVPAVRAASPGVQTAVVGGAAGAGFPIYNWLQRTFFGGARQAVGAQDAVFRGVADSVERVATGKPVRARAMPATSAVLDKLLGDPEQAKKKPAEKFTVIQERLAKWAVAPDAVAESFYQLLKPVADISETLADTMEMVLGVQLDYLLDKMPRDPGTMMTLGKSSWQPTDRELYEFAMHAMGVLMPLETVDLIADGLVPPQAAEALAATNPEIFSKLQFGIMERADEVRANSTYNQRISLGLAFKLPLDPTADARYVAFMQSQHAQKTMEQAAGGAGEANTPEESYSDAQKLLS